MNALESMLIRFGLLKDDLDYHLLRASMVIIFLAFGYQKWWEYEAQVLIPYISNGPLIFWLYPVFVGTVTIIPFMPNGWDPAAGFPAMAGNVPFLVKDIVLLAVSFYLLKQDVMRASLSARKTADTRTAAASVAGASLTAPNQ